MNTEHTSGPWVVSKPSGNYIDAPAINGSIAALTFSATPADARLMAAAPDLLAALRALHACHRAFSSADTWTALDDDARAASEAAIAKAIGEG